MEENQRTPKQNDSAHLWFRQIADVLNDAGYEQMITIGTADTPWTEWSIKVLFVKIAKAMYGKAHTSELTTRQLSEASEVLNRVLGEKGIYVPFPSLEEVNSTKT
jgi:hypothetical protein